MNEQELRQEWFYIYQERLGILADDGDITLAQSKLAKAEADEAVKDLRLSSNSDNSPEHTGTNLSVSR